MKCNRIGSGTGIGNPQLDALSRVHDALLELATGGVNIGAAGVANRGLDTARSEHLLQLLDLLDGGGAEGAVGDVVQLNEVNMAQRALAEVAEGEHLRIGVVYAVDHRILVSGAATGLFDIVLQRLVQTQERVLLDAGHELVARALDGGVERDSEGELLGELGKLTDAGDNAAGRDREVARADVKTVGAVKHAQSLDHRVVVGKGLALAHKDHAGDALAKIALHVQDLVHDFLCGKGAREAGKAGGAKRAAHTAARLRGNADSELAARGHADSLHRHAVRELQQVLARTVARDLLGDLNRRVKREALGKLRAQGLGQVSHLVKRSRLLLAKPLDKLLSAKRRLAKFLDKGTNLVLGERADIAQGRGGFHCMPFCSRRTWQM